MKLARARSLALATSVVLLAACGGEDEQRPAERRAPEPASAETIAKDPYAITCGHVRDQQEWASVTRQATVAIAEREQFRKLNRLRASQSLYFAMTEVCKQKPLRFEPAAAAAKGVREGTFRVRVPDHDAG